jgi:tRNA(Ile)-lysidine synthetase-like protein
LEEPPQSGESDLAAGLSLFLEDNLCWIAASLEYLPTDHCPQMPDALLELGAPARLELPQGWSLEASLSAPGPSAFANRDPFQAWIDPLKIHLPFTIRRRQPGDRFCPMGMQGKSLKLSDLMINERVPRRLRAAWPLVCRGEEILWVPGVRQGNAGQIDPGVKQAIHLRMQRDIINDNIE